MQGQWVDQLRIYARGGAGGQGSKRLGGHGGKGGDVVVSACEGTSLTALSRLTSQRFVAGSGKNSSKYQIFGDGGSDLMIKVPPGTVILGGKGAQVRVHVCVSLVDSDVMNNHVSPIAGNRFG